MDKIEREIEAKLKSKVSPRSLIMEGYKKSTVYKIAHNLGLTKSNRFLESKYKVIELAKVYNDVKMSLHEQQEIKLPISLPRLVTKQEPDLNHVIEPQTDEERIAKRMIDGIKKYAPQLFETVPAPTTGMLSYPTAKSLTEITIILSTEGYRRLGSPAIDEVITVKLSKGKRLGVIQ